VKKQLQWWKCVCGKRFQATAAEIMSGGAECPQCRSLVKPNEAMPADGPPADETQMLNLREMAQMAQKGVDLNVSDEWDTSFIQIEDEDEE